MENTNKLIKDLVKNEIAIDQVSFKSLSLNTLLRFTVYAVATYLFLPIKSIDFSLVFLVETLLWIFLVVFSLKLLYKSSIPSVLKKSHVKYFSYFLIIFLGVIFLRENFSLIKYSFSQEMDLIRGRCGFIIAGIAMVESFFLVKWASKQASTNTELTSLFMAFTAGSIGSLLMQFVCEHENPLHLGLWHFIPIFIVAYSLSKINKKLLKW